eukprot:TRINITY_DN36621_c0_g1_i1.p1 TRINITY_DN36621_c0_g1~~TRINITY_DN36621_c0_g1_i1.p1  ORF type:complete len:390 (+),score=72.96 TRINITY_DN36621_c0_g1_i1:72-1241(+)
MAGCCRGLLFMLTLAAALAPCSGASLRQRSRGNEDIVIYDESAISTHPEWLHSFLAPYNLLHVESIPMFASRPFLAKVSCIAALLFITSAFIFSSSGHGVSEKVTAIKSGETPAKSEPKEEEAEDELTNEEPPSLSEEHLQAIQELKKALPEPEKTIPALLPGFAQLESKMMFVPAVADTTCCAGGIMALFTKNSACARRKACAKEVRFSDEEKGKTSKSFANDGLCSLATPRSSEQNASPDFSGTWKCVKTEGAMDGFLQDLGKNYCKRKACAAFRFGAGMMIRKCEHVGNHLKVSQSIIGVRSLTQEWDIGKEEQEVAGKDEPFLQTAHWDPDDKNVLVIESKDLKKSKPRMWTTSRQYFVDDDRFRIDSTSGGGHTASWIFQRQAA